MRGLDFVSEVKLRVKQDAVETLPELILRLLAELLDRVTPCKDEIKDIEANHIKAIQSFFIFFRGLMTAGLISWILYFAFLLRLTLSYSGNDFSDMCVAFLGAQLPCFLQYSRIVEDLGALYAFTLTLFGIAALYLQLR